MNTDPIADFLIRIKNGYMARKLSVEVPFSKIKYEIAKTLAKEGYLGKIDLKKAGTPKVITVELVYKGKAPRLTHVIRESKPAKRVYVKANEIPKVLGGLGTTIVSTQKGIMTGNEAKKRSLGGELICRIW